MQRERQRVNSSYARNDCSTAPISDSRLVEIARRIMPDAVNLIERGVQQKYRKNAEAEILLLALKDFTTYNYVTGYTLSQHLLFNRLQLRLDSDYYSSTKTDCQHGVVESFSKKLSLWFIEIKSSVSWGMM